MFVIKIMIKKVLDSVPNNIENKSTKPVKLEHPFYTNTNIRKNYYLP